MVGIRVAKYMLCGARSTALLSHIFSFAVFEARPLLDKVSSAASWFAVCKPLTDVIKPLSRLLADEFRGGEFVLDDMALIGMPSLPNVLDYLAAWEARFERSPNVPALLRSRLEIG